MAAAVVAVASVVTGIIGGGGFVAAAVSFVVKAGLTMAAAYAARSLLGKGNKGAEYTATLRDRSHVIRSSVAPRRVVYGMARVSGPLVFAASSGENNAFLHLVIPLASHEVDAVLDLYVDDEAVSHTAGADGWRVASSGRYTSTGKDGADNPGILQWRVHLGTADQTADAHLMAAFPQKWTAAHRLRGVAYLYVKAQWNSDVWGGVPNISAIVRGKRLYDPRTGITAWSDNPALMVRDYLTSDYGIGADAEEIDDASFVAGANVCDETVSVNDQGATQRRYWAGGVIFLDEQPISIMEKLLSACAGTLPYSAGQYRFYPGAYRTPVTDITADELRGPVKVRTARARADRCNAVGGTYVDAARKYVDGEFPAVTNPLYEAEDHEPIERDLTLSFTPDPVLAQRLARVELERARQGITVEWPGTFGLLRCAVMEPVRITVPELGWSNKVFLPVSWKMGPAGVDMTFAEESPAIYDWNRGHALTYDPAPNTNLPDPFYVAPPGAVTVTGETAMQADGTSLSMLRVAWTPSPDLYVRQYAVQWRDDEAVGAVWQGRIVSADVRAELVGPLAAGTSASVRVAAVNGAGRYSVWVSPDGPGVAEPDTQAPGPPVNVTATGDARAILLAWTNDPAPDLARVEIWGGATADVAAHTRLASVPGDRWVHVGAVGTWFYRLRSVDRSGNLSDWHSGLPVSATGRLLGAAELQQRFIDTSLLLDDLAARVISIDELAASYTNLATNQAATDDAVALVREDVNVIAEEGHALAERVETVQTRLGGNVATVQQIATSVDGIKAQYTVKTQLVSADGRRYVAGFGLVSEMVDGHPTSEFLVLADRFGIGKPNVGQPVFPFVVMDVDGVPTVVISNAVIGKANVDTLNLAGNAVTVPIVAERGELLSSDGEWVTSCTVGMPSSNVGRTDLVLVTFAHHGVAGAAGNATYQVIDDFGNTLFSHTGGNSHVRALSVARVVPDGGARGYSFRFARTDGDGPAQISSVVMTVLGCKR